METTTFKPCDCETCKLRSELDAMRTERDYFRRQATTWASVVARQDLGYAESVQLDDFKARHGNPYNAPLDGGAS